MDVLEPDTQKTHEAHFFPANEVKRVCIFKASGNRKEDYDSMESFHGTEVL